MLLHRRNRRAKGHTTFKVVLGAGTIASSPAIAAKLADTGAVALYATDAERVRLHWRNDTWLVISCEMCGIEQIDIMERRNRLGPVQVLYEGFPKGVAGDITDAGLDSLVEERLRDEGGTRKQSPVGQNAAAALGTAPTQMSHPRPR
jgi:hypothetical protein